MGMKADMIYRRECKKIQAGKANQAKHQQILEKAVPLLEQQIIEIKC
jgi:hypothetical protein